MDTDPDGWLLYNPNPGFPYWVHLRSGTRFLLSDDRCYGYVEGYRMPVFNEKLLLRTAMDRLRSYKLWVHDGP